MTQFKEKPVKIDYDNLKHANQSVNPEISQKSFYNTFVHYYAKFMMMFGIVGQYLFYTQAYKIFTTKSAANVSLEGFSVSCFCLSCWLLYGLLIRDKVLVIANVVGVVGAVLVISAILKFS